MSGIRGDSRADPKVARLCRDTLGAANPAGCPAGAGSLRRTATERCRTRSGTSSTTAGAGKEVHPIVGYGSGRAMPVRWAASPFARVGCSRSRAGRKRLRRRRRLRQPVLRPPPRPLPARPARRRPRRPACPVRLRQKGLRNGLWLRPYACPRTRDTPGRCRPGASGRSTAAGVASVDAAVCLDS